MPESEVGPETIKSHYMNIMTHASGTRPQEIKVWTFPLDEKNCSYILSFLPLISVCELCLKSAITPKFMSK